METAEGLCNRFVRNQMMASEPRDAEDFVRCAVQVLQAERAQVCIDDSTEGRDGLEPVSRQIAAGEREMAKRQRQRRSPAGEERGRPRQEGTSRRSPPAEGIHELRRARRKSEEALCPPGVDAPRGGGEVAGAERAREVPPPPTWHHIQRTCQTG